MKHLPRKRGDDQESNESVSCDETLGMSAHVTGNARGDSLHPALLIPRTGSWLPGQKGPSCRIVAAFGKVSGMKTLELLVPEEVASRIERAASDRGVSVEELVRTSVEEKLARDAEFEHATAAVLAKNAELYRRLA